jgi:hypothetical protein
MISAYIFLKGTVFNMIGNGQHIQPLYPGFPHPVGRPDQAVGKHRMRMKVAPQNSVSIHPRQRHLHPVEVFLFGKILFVHILGKQPQMDSN